MVSPKNRGRAARMSKAQAQESAAIREYARLVDVDAGIVHGDAFSRAAVLAAEQTAIFRRSWMFLALESQLRNGARFNTWMGTDAVTVDRSGTGRLRARASGDGLHPVPRVEALHGLVFGCWNPDAPALSEVASGALEQIASDFGSPGVKLLEPLHRWMIEENWKRCVAPLGKSPIVESVRIGLAESVRLVDSKPPMELNRDISPDIRVFPTFSYLPHVRTIRVWHPRGARRTEVWAWVLIESAASIEVHETLAAFAESIFPADGPLVPSAPREVPGIDGRWLDVTNSAFYEQWRFALATV